jgi:hypothetical protein
MCPIDADDGFMTAVAIQTANSDVAVAATPVAATSVAL